MSKSNKSINETGPEYKFTEIKRAAYLALLSKGGRRVASAETIGVCYQTVRKYVREHPEFQEEIEDAELDACEPVEDKLRSIALAGNFSAIVFWLMNRSRGRWVDKRQPALVVPKDERPSKEVSHTQLVDDLQKMVNAARESKGKKAPDDLKKMDKQMDA